MFRGLRKDLEWLSPQMRVVLFLMAALVVLVCAISWSVPLLGELERRAFDARVDLYADVAEQDDQIILISYDENTVRSTGERMPVDRTILAKALPNIEAGGAKAIAIDMLFDEPQEDDALLVAALKNIGVPTFIGYAAPVVEPFGYDVSFESNQMRFLNEFKDSINNPNVHFTRVDLRIDRDGVARSWPASDAEGPPRMAEALAGQIEGTPDFSDYEGLIHFRKASDLDVPIFANLGIDFFRDAEFASVFQREGMLQDKIVLIGTDLADIDRFQIPAAESSVSGLEVHAHMAAQVLDGVKLTPVAGWWNFLAAAASLFAGLGLARCFERRSLLIPALIISAGAIFAAYFGSGAVLASAQNLAVIGCIAALAAGAWLGHAIRRMAKWEQGRTATLALHKYLPPDIAESIVTRPDRLGLQGEMRDVFVIFTDLEGFTQLCQSIEAETVATFLNEYLEEVSQVVLDHGGTIDKFVGDAVVAFWGAPVSTEDDAINAVRAAIAILELTEKYRGRRLGDSAVVGRTRIGLHYGPAIVGNFGGEGRLQYTALGDTMNVAARLEGANKQMGTSILLSSDVHAFVKDEVPCRSMGKVRVRGREQPLEIFEPSADLTGREVAELNAFYTAALDGDEDATKALRDWSASHPDDEKFANAVKRLNDEDGGTTDLS